MAQVDQDYAVLRAGGFEEFLDRGFDDRFDRRTRLVTWGGAAEFDDLVLFEAEISAELVEQEAEIAITLVLLVRRPIVDRVGVQVIVDADTQEPPRVLPLDGLQLRQLRIRAPGLRLGHGPGLNL